MPLVLAIETSCDETSVAVVEDKKVLSNIVLSQIEIHGKFGGVVPEIAARQHLKNLPVIYKEAVYQSNINLSEIDAIAVTIGPGLIGALLVGLSFAKGVSVSLNKPLIGVNHLLGHVCAAHLAFDHLTLPYVALLVSGGHTELLVFENSTTKPKVLGRTLDDAAGEAFDKVARLLNIGYPGGPAIEKISKDGDPHKYNFPRAMIEKENLDFSFSGLKTSVLYLLQKERDFCVADVAASFQEAVIDVLVEKAASALQMTGLKKLVVSGGVASNTRLREKLSQTAKKMDFELYIPPKSLCTDNAAMIAQAATEILNEGVNFSLSVTADPALSF
ncbi:tRNA (adenosine(37)-N6)-threonylcarbamoyltransferase complex transferase subunit TsaD [Thermotoga profunda]|uniref:tRNA (adenosine(37)-N6)-threonylcarbamoyltransferase complex transferase subunit TsaD n=1 Tax=Thermotoga profunda TaxID=1508420 RepID=UPI000694D43D|nr:tRNA (adenosine(37)-N6)-threonylcarbamoyltransferase complex transferase subunit TsaD [Thermotoga profunda]